ncbi:hypothetical protein IG631_15696 [Alternaria alternata]|nr:hypothetical protein IG631_15696 [Alternaria alternata]
MSQEDQRIPTPVVCYALARLRVEEFPWFMTHLTDRRPSTRTRVTCSVNGKRADHRTKIAQLSAFSCNDNREILRLKDTVITAIQAMKEGASLTRNTLQQCARIRVLDFVSTEICDPSRLFLEIASFLALEVT